MIKRQHKNKTTIKNYDCGKGLVVRGWGKVVEVWSGRWGLRVIRMHTEMHI